MSRIEKALAKSANNGKFRKHGILYREESQKETTSKHITIDPLKVSNELVALLDSSSVYAEQFKNLRTHIFISGAKKSHWLCLVTSSVKSELIGSEKMETLLEEIKTRYNNRYIIIDSPPLLPITDSSLLEPIVDRTIILISKGLPKNNLPFLSEL